MLTVYSEDHRHHDGKAELFRGEMVPCFEMPERANMILNRVKTSNLGDIIEPDDFGMDPILAIHDKGFVDFLTTVWDEWLAIGCEGEVFAISWPTRRMRERIPKNIEGKVGYYALAIETPITEGTFKAARSSVNVALSAQKKISAGEEHAVFALCRPPGHHAAYDQYGGYCFFNNAAIAAQGFLDDGCKKVAILDVDFHHGNGTQDIFYERDDVFFASLHGSPDYEFPFYLGWDDETGRGKGDGFNINYPMMPGTTFDIWFKALQDACERIKEYGAEALVISLGVDTYAEDPISSFKLQSPDFITYGKYLAKLGLPTLFVMEGGYAVEEIGINAVNVLQGFESGNL